MAERERLRIAVVESMRSVPAGRVATYGDIAEAVGIGPRHAGRLVAQESDAGPWWRIVYADGRTAHCHGGTAPELLRAEGVSFLGQRVDMKTFRIGAAAHHVSGAAAV
jgi:alkylated DNA nucleotide flippase Atl1